MIEDTLVSSTLSKITKNIFNNIDQYKLYKRINIGKISNDNVARYIKSTVSLEMIQDLFAFHGIRIDIDDIICSDVLYQLYNDVLYSIKNNTTKIQKDVDFNIDRLLNNYDCIITPAILSIYKINHYNLDDYTILNRNTNRYLFFTNQINETINITTVPNDLTINIESITENIIMEDDYSPKYSIEMKYSIHMDCELIESYNLSRPEDY